VITVPVDVGDRQEAGRRRLLGATEREPNFTAGQLAVDRATGEPLVLVARYPDMRQLRWAFQAFPNSTILRAAGVRNSAVSFGYTSRAPVMQRYACRACDVARTSPEAHSTVTAAAETLWSILHEELPEVAMDTMGTALSAISPTWLMNRSPWTSGVMNTTSPLPYHYDRNNLPTWSAMVVARRGVRGGHLHIPQLDLTIDCRDGDVVYFPGWKYLHGVTPMHLAEKGAYRFSAVYYTIAKMRHCLEPEEELTAGRKLRTDAEDGMIERQRTSGHYAG